MYDGVGKATFPASLDCLKPFGMFASFGSASGGIEAFDLGLLGRKGSLFATRPTLFTFIADRARLENMARDLFRAVGNGDVTVRIGAKPAARRGRRGAPGAGGARDDGLHRPSAVTAIEATRSLPSALTESAPAERAGRLARPATVCIGSVAGR